jgi:hypothetical protein
MAKGQRRSNRELKKPKQPKKPVAPGLAFPKALPGAGPTPGKKI